MIFKKRKIDKFEILVKSNFSFYKNEEIENYLEVQEWQISHIKEALNQADNNEFASDNEILKVFLKRK